MPHLSIEYSSNVEQWIDFSRLCDLLRKVAVDTQLFPLTGIRVRAICCNHYSLADGSKENGFIDISVRLREGRTLTEKRVAADGIFNAARDFLQDVMRTHPIALSLEIRDIDALLSPKINGISRHMQNDPSKIRARE